MMKIDRVNKDYVMIERIDNKDTIRDSGLILINQSQTTLKEGIIRDFVRCIDTNNFIKENDVCLYDGTNCYSYENYDFVKIENIIAIEKDK